MGPLRSLGGPLGGRLARAATLWFTLVALGAAVAPESGAPPSAVVEPTAGRAVPTETAVVGTLSIERGGEPTPWARADAEPSDRSGRVVVERFRDVGELVEQTWRFGAAPAGEGPLRIQVSAPGDYRGGSPAGLLFAAADGSHWRYGHATWIDADGVRVNVPAKMFREHILLEVPAAVLGASRYPAVLDPLIGPVDAVVAHEIEPIDTRAIAVAGDDDRFLVMWGPGDFAQFVFANNRSTIVAGDAEPLLPETGNDLLAEGVADVAAVADGFVTVFAKFDNMLSLQLDADGVPVSGQPHILMSGAFNPGDPTVTPYSADRVLATYRTEAANGDFIGHAQLLDGSGAPVAPPWVIGDGAASAACRNGTCVAAWCSDQGVRAAYLDVTAGSIAPPGVLMLTNAACSWGMSRPWVVIDDTSPIVFYVLSADTIWAQRLESFGVVTPPFAVATTPEPWSVALASRGGDTLLTWRDDSYEQRAMRIGTDDSLLDGPTGFLLSTYGYGVRIGATEAGYLFAWSEADQVRSQRLDDGALGAARDIGSRGTTHFSPAAAERDGETAVAFVHRRYLHAGYEPDRVAHLRVVGFDTDGSTLPQAAATDVAQLEDWSQITPTLAAGTSTWLIGYTDQSEPTALLTALVGPDHSISPGPVLSYPDAAVEEYDIAFGAGRYVAAMQVRPDGCGWGDCSANVLAIEAFDESGASVFSSSQATYGAEYGSPQIAAVGDHFVVSWTDGVLDQGDIRAVVVGPDGELSETIDVHLGPNTQYATDAAAIGDRALVAWSDYENAAISTAHVAYVALDGSVEGPIRVSYDNDSAVPRIVDPRDGHNLLVVWHGGSFSLSSHLYGNWLNADGDLVDGLPTLLAIAEEGGEVALTPGPEGFARLTFAHHSSQLASPQLETVLVAAGELDGVPCAAASDCASRICQSGFCCEVACDEACRTCADEPGTCTLVRDQEHDSCFGLQRCSAAGECLANEGQPCNGADECASGHCVDGFCCNSACDGACERCNGPPGICTELACSPYGCGEDDVCLSRCESSADCDEGFQCLADGTCVVATTAPPEVVGGCAVAARRGASRSDAAPRSSCWWWWLALAWLGLRSRRVSKRVSRALRVVAPGVLVLLFPGAAEAVEIGDERPVPEAEWVPSNSNAFVLAPTPGGALMVYNPNAGNVWRVARLAPGEWPTPRSGTPHANVYQAAITFDGSHHLLFYYENGAIYAREIGTDAVWQGEGSIVPLPPPGVNLSRRSFRAASHPGGTLVAYVDNENSYDTGAAQVVALDLDHVPLTTPTVIDTAQSVVLAYGDDRHLAVTTAGDARRATLVDVVGDIITAIDLPDVSGCGTGLVAYDPALVFAQGGFVMAWLDDRDGGCDVYARRIGSDGTVEPEIMLAVGSSAARQLGIAAVGDTVAVGWTDGPNAYMSRLSTDDATPDAPLGQWVAPAPGSGVTFGLAGGDVFGVVVRNGYLEQRFLDTQLAPLNEPEIATWRRGNQLRAALAVNGDRELIAWEEETNSGYVQRHALYDLDGNLVGEPGEAPSYSRRLDVVAAGEGQGWLVYARDVYDFTARARLVSQVGEVSDIAFTEPGIPLDTVALVGDRFLAIGRATENQLRGRYIGVDGSVEPSFVVAQLSPSCCDDVRVDVLANGDEAFVFYTDLLLTTDVHVRRIGSDGTVGPAVLVAGGPADQTGATATLNDEGRMLVTWDERSPEGLRSVKGLLVDDLFASDPLLQTPFVISPTTAAQWLEAAWVGDGANFVVARFQTGYGYPEPIHAHYVSLDGKLLDVGGVPFADDSEETDMTSLGDGQSDFVVMRRDASIDSSVVVARRISSGVLYGGQCDEDGDCAARLCVDDVCCHAECATCERCEAGTGLCVVVTGEPDDSCFGGQLCNDAGECASALGQPCELGECASGHCVDGVCCESACDGACDRCNETPGICEPLDCGTYACGESDECLNTCRDSADCAVGYQCLANGQCVVVAPAGETVDGGCGCRAAGGDAPARSGRALLLGLLLAMGVRRASRRRGRQRAKTW